MEIKGRVVLVTGAGSGIGRALAERFAEVGADAVVCTDLDGGRAGETAGLVGPVASAATLDVADEAAIEAQIAATEARYGRLDILVSNAGYGQAGGLDLPTSDWMRMMAVHTWSHLAAARAAIPGMVARGGGYLLNTASAAGLLTQIDSGPYAVSKHAAVALAEWLAINYAEQGIGVSVLCPQAVRTNILGDRAARGRGSSGQASGDGILEPQQVADACIEAIQDERFLVLPHPQVATYFKRKADDYDRWLAGMRRLRKRLQETAEQ